jgi:glycosyltransferase involved in cell wall biosynthesis
MDYVAARSPSGRRIQVVPNGTTRFWLDAVSLQPDRAALRLPTDRFIWTYAGNVGAAQGLGTAIEAADQLDERFALLIVGDGPLKAELERRAASVRGGSVIFRDQVDPKLAREYLRASDALLVPLKADRILEAFVPSKLFDFCAVGRPVVVAAAGEPARLVAQQQAALTVPPDDAVELASKVRSLASNPALGSRIASNGRELAAQHLREAHVERLAALVESLSRQRDARRP